MRPPIPSTSSVTPIKSGATSCTLRAKKLRPSTRPCVVTDERRKREPEQSAAGDTRDATRDDREPEARRRRQCPRLEVANRRRGRDLHELDPRDAPEHRARRDPVEHHGAQDRADLVAEAGEAQQEQREPELLCEAEGGDRDTPQRRGHDDAEPLATDVPQRPREQRHEQCSDRRRREQEAAERRIPEAVPGEGREERGGIPKIIALVSTRKKPRITGW